MVWSGGQKQQQESRHQLPDLTKFASQLGHYEVCTLPINLMHTQHIFPEEIANNLENNQKRHGIAIMQWLRTGMLKLAWPLRHQARKAL